MKSLSLPKSLRQWRILPRVAVLGFLLVLVTFAAVPGYLTGNWTWKQPPPVTILKQLKELRKTGLELPGWKTLEHKTVRIGGHEWSIQAIGQGNPKPVIVMLLPQNGPKNQPQVEWVDIGGSQQWQTDSHTTMKFKQASGQHVEANFFRAWNQQQTVAVLQWYAWPGGGHPDITRWFWADQFAQLHRQRVPWVAVCLQIPMEPLGDLEASRPLAESLGNMIQSALMAGPFAKASSS